MAALWHRVQQAQICSGRVESHAAGAELTRPLKATRGMKAQNPSLWLQKEAGMGAHGGVVDNEQKRSSMKTSSDFIITSATVLLP
jgi:hypothetical protein